MPLGVHVQITNEGDGAKVRRGFPQRTVRIGRSPLNDLQIDDGSVSPFHAVLEMHNERVYLRDLGSRTGTRVVSGRAPAHELVDLGREANTFAIANFSFNAIVGSVVTVAPPPPAPTHTDDTPRAPPSVAPGSGNGLGRTQLLEPSKFPPRNVAFEPAVISVRPLHLDDEPEEKTVITSPEAVKQLLDDASNPAERAARERELADFALACLRELTASYLPGERLQKPEDVARFLSRTRDVLELFFRSFLPIRDAYRHVSNALDSARPTEPATGVDAARDVQQLAAWLLDPKNDMAAGRRAVDGTIADLMIHQLALLNGVMRGLKGLFAELAPVTIESAFESYARNGRAGFHWGPWRFREVWALYKVRHHEVHEGDPRVFAALFGRDFAAAYANYRASLERDQTTTAPRRA